MTRARSNLLLSCAARRTRHGAEQAGGRSSFLAAIEPALLGKPTAGRRPRKNADQQLRLL
jgi:superfamily I DNA/RNA helicase